MTHTLWDSSIGKKTIMAVSGLIMLGYLIVHMMGNLKIFFGSDGFPIEAMQIAQFSGQNFVLKGSVIQASSG